MTTISTHTTTATLIHPSGNVVLSLREDNAGEISFDAGRVPHVEGSITVSVEDAAMLDKLDPRDSRRVIIEVTGQFPDAIRTRTFDLGIRSARPNRADGTVTLGLASDEKLLEDFAPLADDGKPRRFESSLRAVTRYALDQAHGCLFDDPYGVIGTNWFAASSAGVVTLTQDAGLVGASAPTAMRATFTSGTATYAGLRTGNIPVTPGAVYSARTEVRSSRSRPVQLRIEWFNAANVNVSSALASVAAPGVLAWQTITASGTAPATAAYARLAVRLTSAPTIGDYIQVTGLKVAAGTIPPPTLDPGPDADVTAYWPITNMLTNPSMETNADGWLAGNGASGLTAITMAAPAAPAGSKALEWTTAVGDSNVVPLTSKYRVTPGRWYVFSAYVCSGVPRQARAAIQWWAAGGTVASSTAYGVLTTSDATQFRRISVIAQCPPGATEAVPYVNTINNATGNKHYVDCAMFYEGDELVPYYDGGTPDSAAYVYDWQAAAHGSTSTRTPVVERRPEALVWRAGDSGMGFLHPLLMASGLRMVCDERRRWTLRAAAYTAEGVQAWRYGVNIETADELLSRDDDSWFDAAVYVYVWSDGDGIEQTRVDSFALTAAPTKVLRVELRNTPYPGPGRAQAIVKRAQGTGRTVTVSGIPSWTENTDQLLTITLEGTPAQTGIAGTVSYDLSADTVTVTSRTTDTPAGSINLLAGTIDALAGTINSL